MIIDGAATVHFLPPLSMERDFLDYAQKRMIPYVEGMMAYCDKMDIVFDQYFSDSLKTAVREKR